jgi:hypothetical protein
LINIKIIFEYLTFELFPNIREIITYIHIAVKLPIYNCSNVLTIERLVFQRILYERKLTEVNENGASVEWHTVFKNKTIKL